MKPLSQSLEDLAVRVEVLEDSAISHLRGRPHQLEPRRHEIDDAIKSEVSEFDSAVRQAVQAGRTAWNDTKASLKRPLDEVRARIDHRQSEHELHRALRSRGRGPGRRRRGHRGRGLLPERRRVRRHRRPLARMAADDLAAVPAPTVGATS